MADEGRGHPHFLKAYDNVVVFKMVIFSRRAVTAFACTHLTLAKGGARRTLIVVGLLLATTVTAIVIVVHVVGVFFGIVVVVVVVVRRTILRILAALTVQVFTA